MTVDEFLGLYRRQAWVQELLKEFSKKETGRVRLDGLTGSARSVVAAAVTQEAYQYQLFVLNDKTEAAYFHNDLEKLFGEQELDYDHRHILLFPASWRRPYDVESCDNANVLMRTEVLHRLECNDRKTVVVTYPEALAEKVVTRQFIEKKTIKLILGQKLSHEFMLDVLDEHGFERVDFALEPGQYAVRGGIIDVFAYAGDYPYRIEFFGDTIESIRSFDPMTQLSREQLKQVTLLPNVQNSIEISGRASLLAHFPADTVVWIEKAEHLKTTIDQAFSLFEKAYAELQGPIKHSKPEELQMQGCDFLAEMEKFAIVEWIGHYYKPSFQWKGHFQPQPAFNKQFQLLVNTLLDYSDQGYTNMILSENSKQIQRLERVFFEMTSSDRPLRTVPITLSLHEGFVDADLRLCCFTDHQIFERYHRYTTHRQIQNREAITLKTLYDLKPGDFVTHIDHGVGRFSGLEKIEVGGHQQETIRLVYKENDVLYVSIHSLHKISRYSGKEGAEPTLTRLGSNTWANLKSKTKQRVKDIAKDLIKLYAQRKSSKGFAFAADSYLQHELEASFFYEDTPDQWKATNDVKHDMEGENPMDRLVCGDVGFGKTEVAIRAAFKAVADGKQVAVLVPTTILAFQHYKTFTERLHDMPCRVDYLSRFRSTKERNAIIRDLANGKIDILIGTHRIVGKDIAFKDLGLLVIDEEQKFGVAMKEKLKQLKINVDTLALSATPIPRTLQFSLMGARDMSIISTPPPNRYPIHTEVQTFDETLIRDAILQELSRGGQVFFVHSRVQNIFEIAGIVQRLVPDAKIAVAHGQMDGEKLEDIMMAFIEGVTDILISTKIVENGLDIPNANTIIINEAQAYGLSELHQLRGRVGRSNRKSFCYLVAPPDYMLSDEAKKRLRAIEEFSEIGSGFNIAMRDLDIRGAGNVLGAEQSGFVNEIGFDMYHKILDEAIRELKTTEFKDLYDQPLPELSKIPRECQIETDLEILIPDDYVSSITERISLYKELDALETAEEIDAYEKRLEDRFGPLPKPAKNLVLAVHLRREARRLGFERIVLRRGELIGTFISDPQADYYQSELFGRIIQYVQTQNGRCELKEHNDKLNLLIHKISSVAEALEGLPRLAIEDDPAG